MWPEEVVHGRDHEDARVVNRHGEMHGAEEQWEKGRKEERKEEKVGGRNGRGLDVNVGFLVNRPLFLAEDDAREKVELDQADPRPERSLDDLEQTERDGCSDDAGPRADRQGHQAADEGVLNDDAEDIA